ncbi:MAG: protein kinase domain-containing protein [Nannocystales bacterium]
MDPPDLASEDCPGDNTLAALAHGRQDVDATLSEHLAQCELCQALLAELLRDDSDEGGRYTILELIGVGGMGLVVRARDTLLEREVALKVLRSADGVTTDTLLSEARALARIEHSNIVTIYDAGRLPRLETPFIAMELVRGETLRDWLQHPRGWPEIRDVFLDAARGLAAAHAAGIVHSDFKPANVLMPEDGSHARVTDFGLAFRPTDTSPRFGGTPRYMAPEQRIGGASMLADQYAFGVALYEALYGRHPWRVDVCPAPGAPGSTPRWLRRLCRRCLRDDPAARYPAMEEIVRAMARTRFSRAGIGLAGVCLAAIPVTLQVAGDECARDIAEHRVRWNEHIRPELAQGLEGDDWGRVRPSADRWVEGWLEAKSEACRAEAAPAVHRCLAGRWATLEALSRDLKEDAPQRQSTWQLAILTLPSVRACRSATGDDASEGPEAERLTQCVLSIAEGRASLLLGDAEGAQQSLEEAVLLAERYGFVGMQARAELALAKAHWQRAQPDAAFEAFSRAAAHAIAADLPNVGATALAESARFVAISRQDLDLAWSMLRQARAFPGHSTLTAINLDRVEAWLLHLSDDSENAIALMRSVVHRTEAGARAPSLANVTNREDLALVLDRAGHSDAALRELALALEMRVALLGPRHASVARATAIRALVLQGEDRLEEAVEMLDTVVEILRASQGPDSEAVASVCLQRADVLLDLGRVHDAAVSLETPRRVYLDASGRDAVRASLTRQIGARLARMNGEPELARTMLRQLLQEHHPPLSPQREALVRRELGLASLDLGEPGEAVEHLRRALEGAGIRDPIARGEVAFAQAQALAAADPCGTEAIGMALEALKTLRSATSSRASDKADAVSRWLETCGA